MFKISKVFTLSVIALVLMSCCDEKGTGWTPDMIPEDVVENDTTSTVDTKQAPFIGLYTNMV